jgi:alanine racemase
MDWTPISRITARIDEERFSANIAALRSLLPPGAELAGGIEVDGRGFGAARMARILTDNGVPELVVQTVDEGLGLRGGGVESPVIVAGETPLQRVCEAAEAGLVLSASSLTQVEDFSRAASAKKLTAPLQLKIDAGADEPAMPKEQVLPVLTAVMSLPGVAMDGLYARVPAPPESQPVDDAQTTDSLSRLDELFGTIDKTGLLPKAIRLAGSNVLAGFHEQLAADRYTRFCPGAAVYGLHERSFPASVAIGPAVTIATRIIGLTKRSRTRAASLAVLPVGFGHGLSPALARDGWVLVDGAKARVYEVGLSQSLIDVTDLETPAVTGAEVVLAGPELPPAALAAEVGCDPWELVTPLLQHAVVE